jgi:hypothetical protein
LQLETPARLVIGLPEGDWSWVSSWTLKWEEVSATTCGPTTGVCNTSVWACSVYVCVCVCLYCGVAEDCSQHEPVCCWIYSVWHNGGTFYNECEECSAVLILHVWGKHICQSPVLLLFFYQRSVLAVIVY